MDSVPPRASAAAEPSAPFGRAASAPWVLAVALPAFAAGLTAVAFPETPAGALSGLALVCAGGAGLALAWPSLAPLGETAVGRRAVHALVYAAVLAVAWRTYGEVLSSGATGWPADFGPHHANVALLYDALVRDGIPFAGHIPRYTHLVAGGDAPFEIYPAPTYVLTVLVTWALGMRDQIPQVIAGLGTACHVAVGVVITRLALRCAPWPAALVAGAAWVTDGGEVFDGGMMMVLRWGMTHQLTAQTFALLALALAAGTAERGATPGRSLATWTLAGLGAATHPFGILTLVGVTPAVGVAALTARDAEPRRLWRAALDLGLGLLASAAWWMPHAERAVLYGLHYGNWAATPADAVRAFLHGAYPRTSFHAFAVAMLAGAVAGLLSRRWLPTMCAGAGVFFLSLYVDVWPLVTGLAPSHQSVRFTHHRGPGLAKPLLTVAAAYALGCIARPARAWATRAWAKSARDAGSRRDAPPARRREAMGRAVTGAVLAATAVLVVRGLVPVAGDHARALARSAEMAELRDGTGFGALVAWARERAAENRPDAFGRLLFIEGGDRLFPIYHLTARAKLPTVTLGILPGFILRERIDGQSPADLRRWNVRWVASQRVGPALGDPSTERRFGEYVVRELGTWDGLVARVEKGAGTVRTTRLEDEAIDLEVSGSDARTLVVLGVPYYARWRAWQDGRPLPVYGVKAHADAKARVLALRPHDGKVELRCDGPLPSDGAGAVPTAVALLACALLLAWPKLRSAPALASARRAAHERLGRRLTELRSAASWVALAGGAAAAVGVVVLAATQASRPVRAVLPGVRLVADARAFAQVPNGPWQRCHFDVWSATYECGELGRVQGSLPQILNDHGASWGFIVPATVVTPYRNDVTFRVEMSRVIGGKLIAGVWGHGGRAAIDIDDGLPVGVTAQMEINLDDTPREHHFGLTIGTRGTPVSLALVRADALDVDRTSDVPAPPP
jgi:hypothetical protein